MKFRQFFSLLLMATFGWTAAHAQRSVLKINPLSAFILTGNGQYEFAATPNWSLQLGAFGTGARFDLFGWAKVGYSGWGFTPEVRYYPQGLAPKGFYVGGYFRGQYYRAYGSTTVNIKNPATNEVVEGKANFVSWVRGLGVGGVVGYQWIIAKRLSLDFYFGMSVNSVKTDTEVTAQSSDGSIDEDIRFRLPLSPVGVRPGFSLGWAF